MFDKGKTAEKAVKVVRDLEAKYEEILESDYAEYLSGLNPGQTVRPKGRIIADERKRELVKACNDAREDAEAVFDKARAEADEEITKAPSQEAVGYLQTMRGRQHVSQTELDAAVRKYGDNWSCYQALRDIAAEQRKAGNNVAVRWANTLDGVDEFLEAAGATTDGAISEIQRETYPTETERKARVGWFEMAMNGHVIGENNARTAVRDFAAGNARGALAG